MIWAIIVIPSLGVKNTKERLDRAVENQVWSEVYNAVKVESRVLRSLNYKPLLASCGKLGVGTWKY